MLGLCIKVIENILEMLKRRFITGILIFISTAIVAQNGSLDRRLEEIEKSNSLTESVIELKKMLSSKKLTKEETLAVQTTLVHKYQQLKQWDASLNYCQDQITLAHNQNNSFAEATFYKLIGSTYYYIPQKESAVTYWKKCIAIAEPNNYYTLLAQCYHNVGVIYIEENKLSLAEQYFIKAIELSKKNSDTMSATFSLHYRLLATTYDRENKLGEAEKIFLQIISKNRAAKDSANLVESLLFYTNVLKKKKEFEKAILFSKEALSIARKINLIDGVITALDTHAGNLADAQNYKDAYKYKYEEDTLVRTRFSGDLNKKISDAEAAFKNAETTHEKEMAVLKAKKEKQIYIASIIGLLIAAGFAFFFLNQKRKYRRSVEQLKMQDQVQEEKERLSRDLHDNLGSQLALLSNNIEQLDTTNKKNLEVGDEIKKVKTTSRQLLQTLRETIWILNKEEVAVEDFFDKLIDYTSRYLQSYPSIHLSINESFTESMTLNSNHALQLFRICQEAINNACKYSNSDTLLLKGNSDSNGILIAIEDNGTGFEVSETTIKENYGLKNMKQRASSIGAVLNIVSENRKGTSVELTIKS